jgi:putative oxidoreductase
MSVKIKSVAVIAARVVLGLIYFVFGLNFFLHFIPMNGPTPSPQAEAFTTGLFQSGYFFPFLKGLEVIFGALLLAGVFVPLSLVVLVPVSLNILLFHAYLAPEGTAMGVVILLLNLFLAWAYRSAFKPLLATKTPASL